MWLGSIQPPSLTLWLQSVLIFYKQVFDMDSLKMSCFCICLFSNFCNKRSIMCNLCNIFCNSKGKLLSQRILTKISGHRWWHNLHYWRRIGICFPSFSNPVGWFSATFCAISQVTIMLLFVHEISIKRAMIGMHHVLSSFFNSSILTVW